MKNEFILQKAIEKAVSNGYCPTDDGKPIVNLKHTFLGCWFEAENGCDSHLECNQIIFSHKFAKAFWGEELVDPCGWTRQRYINFIKEKMENDESYENIANPDEVCKEIAWQYHIQELALSKYRLKYLETFLNKEV